MADDTDAQRDLLARAVIAEAGGEPDQGQTGVAAVILNRARANGQTVSNVIATPGQFEAWGDPVRRAAVMKISSDDPSYQRALTNVDSALHGSDPTGGATNFLNPKLQAQLGRPQPSWAQGQGVTIGKHVFYGGSGGLSDADLYAALSRGGANAGGAPAATGGAAQGQPTFPAGMSDDDLYRSLTQTPTQDAANAKRQAFEAYASQKFPGWTPPAGAESYYSVPQDPKNPEAGLPGSLVGQFRDENGAPTGAAMPVSDAQIAGVHMLKQLGKFSPNSPAGSEGNPYAPIYGGNYPSQRGAWYIPVDDPNPRQVGDFEIAYNKRKELEASPEGQAALAAAREATQSQFGSLGQAKASFIPNLERGLDQVGSYVDTAANNAVTRPGETNAWAAHRPYSPGQASDAAYVAGTERLGQEAAYAPAVAEGNTRLGNVVEAIPLAEIGGNLLTGVRSAGPVGRFVAGASDGSPLARFTSPIARDAVLGAGVTGTQGYLDTGDVNAIPRNMLTGGGFGGAFGLGARTLGSAGRALLGSPISDARADLAQTAADKYGINLRSSQITGSPFLRTTDELAGVGGSDAAQRATFNRALTQTIGEDAPALTKPVMAQAKARIGQAFEDVANRNTIAADNQFLNDLTTIEGDFKDGPAERIARNRIDDVFNVIKNGNISGRDYLTLTRQGGVIDRAVQSSNADVAEIGRRLRTAMDDALERSVSPQDSAALSTARQQYKAMSTLEPLAAKSGPDGLIDPAAVLPKVVGNYQNYAYTGTAPNDLGELGEIGSTFLKPPAGGYRSVAPWIKGGVGVLGEAGAAGALVAHNPELAGGLAVGSPLAAKGAGSAVRAVVDHPALQRWLLSNNFARVLPAGTEQFAAPITADTATNMLLQTERERQQSKSKAKNPLLLEAQ